MSQEVKKHILIVEDDPEIAGLEKDYLEAEGFQTSVANEGRSGLRMALSGQFDLILLDVMLPGVSGFDICEKIRSESTVPIVLVTARKTDIDKIRGLGLGADDYVIKPFSPLELVARVKAHISMHERIAQAGNAEAPSARHEITAGDLVISRDSRRVLKNGQEVVLTAREFDLLWFLAVHPNIVFSRETLYERIWGMDAVGDTATVMVHVNRLRDKLETDPKHPQHIETVWGAGYRFV